MSTDWHTIGQQLEARSRKGAQTRQRMILAAADLFAEHGIDRVSPSEILEAAGQRNASAIQYHFGSHDGLVVAILQPRPDVRLAMDTQMDAMFDALEAGGQPVPLQAAVRAWVEPAARLLDTREGRSFLRVAIQVVRQLPLADRVVPRHESDRRAHELLLGYLRDLPREVAEERLAAAFTLRVELYANRAREIEHGVTPNLAPGAFTGELVTMLAGLLAAREGVGAPGSR